MKKITLLSLSLLLLQLAHSQAGTLDPSFAGKGWTYTDFESGNKRAEAGRQVLLQKGGTYILVFQVDDYYTMLARYHSDGRLDTSYGNNGYSQTVSMIPNNAVQQKDGKIVVAGDIGVFSIARFNTDGSIDSTFDSDGLLTVEISFSSANGIALQNDGKIVAAGSAFISDTNLYDVIVARINVDGTFDSTFDQDGILTTNFGYQEAANSIAIQRDGKIIVAGSAEDSSTNQNSFALARYNTDGSLDNSFSADGKLVTDFGGDEKATSVSLQDDGKVVVAGSAYYPFVGNSDFLLARYNTDGSLDSPFDNDGMLTTQFGAYSFANSIALQRDGKIFVAGGVYDPNRNNYQFAFARYNTDGTLDHRFDQDGRLVSGSHELGVAYFVVPQEDSKLVVAGVSVDTAIHNSDYALIRLNGDGSLDKSFNGNGKVTGYYPVGISHSNAIALQRDGKIVVAGESEDPETHKKDFALARYNMDGMLDPAFGKAGRITTDFGGDESASSVAIQDDGKIVVAGNSISSVALARYTGDGSLDSSFDGDGKQTIIFGDNENAAFVALQRDGKIVVAGSAVAPGAVTFDFTLARFTGNGSLDSTFDKDGKRATDFGGDEHVGSIALQRDGKIVVAGSAYEFGVSNPDIALARYNIDGSLDTTFDQDGKRISDFGGDETGASLAIQQDGKMLVAGTMYDPNTSTVDFIVVRYDAGGSLDSTFGNKGKVTTDFSSSENASSIALQADGKIVAAGKAYTHNFSTTDFALARYNTNGTLDSSFDGDGKVITDFGGDDDLSSLAINNRVYVVGTNTSLTYRGIIAAYQLGCTEQVYYRDGDQDGYGSIAEKVLACTAPVGYVVDSTDCNDSSAAIHPGAKEICDNGVDDNCNGQVDEDCTFLLTINDTTVYESEGIVILTVTLSRKADRPIYVPYFTMDGTARSFSWSKDYRAAWNILVIPAGAQTATIPIVIYEDNISEPDEYFDMYIFNPLYLAQGYAKGRVTIKDGAPNQTTPPITQTPALEQQQANAQAADRLSAEAYPNPSTTGFTLFLKSSRSGPVVLTVRDASGRVIEQKTGVSANNRLQLGANYRPGVYYAELTQGKEKRTIKLIKQ